MTRAVIAGSVPLDPARLGHLLSRDEIDRLGRLREPADRARSATGRALLRLLVMRRVGRAAAEIAFVTRCRTCGGPHGKPEYVPAPGQSAVHTSLSHVGDCVVAVEASAPVGIDVEQTAAVAFDGFDDVALSASERRQLTELPVSERDVARTELWVRKEAVLKAHGVGLATGPGLVHLGLWAGQRVMDDPLRPGERVALADVPVAAAYRAALAVRSAEFPVITYCDVGLLTAASAARCPPASS